MYSQAVNTSLLYEISGGALTHKSYVFGTIHLLPRGVDWLHGPVANAFDHADELMTELPELPPAEVAAAVMKYGALPAGQDEQSVQLRPGNLYGRRAGHQFDPAQMIVADGGGVGASRREGDARLVDGDGVAGNPVAGMEVQDGLRWSRRRFGR